MSPLGPGEGRVYKNHMIRTRGGILSVLLLAACSCAGDGGAPVQAPRIEFERVRIDAGEVDQGKDVVDRFAFRNGGGSPLAISDVRASCDCVAAVESDAALPPGGTGVIAVRVRTDAVAGPVTRSFTVFSNDPAAPAQRLEVAATVTPLVLVEPRQLYLGEVARGARPAKSVRLSFPRDAAARAVAAESRGAIVAPVWVGAEAAVRSLGVAIAADAPAGPFSETVTVRTTHPQRPHVEIVVAGVVLEPGEQR